MISEISGKFVCCHFDCASKQTFSVEYKGSDEALDELKAKARLFGWRHLGCNVWVCKKHPQGTAAPISK